DRLQNAVERRLRAPAPLAVLLVDLERVDDSGGAAGDAVLRAVARRLQGCVRTEDTVARLGEAVFGVLVDDVGDGPVAVLAERIRAAVGVPVEVGRSASVRLDAGVAVVVSDGGHDADALLAEAEQRIGDIRSSGRGGVELVVVPFG
ncbi:MAG TPA: GGDEF domain-containing protein, partial [Kineosporiaceae bacterium]|nr:GGDEF domain-containing protein [Kineosporiaceae bacterium]